LPINDAAHVRDAMARFDQVTSAGCHPEAAKRRILAAAKKFGVDVKEFQKVKSFKKTYDPQLLRFQCRILRRRNHPYGCLFPNL
jgi:hypothetical protein